MSADAYRQWQQWQQMRYPQLPVAEAIDGVDLVALDGRAGVPGGVLHPRRARRRTER
mgnify:CR=1 FL=1